MTDRISELIGIYQYEYSPYQEMCWIEMEDRLLSNPESEIRRICNEGL